MPDIIGIIHRNLKPRVVLLTPGGFNSASFGIARTLVRLAEEKAKPNVDRLRESSADSRLCGNYIKRPSTELDRKALQNAHPKGWAHGRTFVDERKGTRATEDL